MVSKSYDWEGGAELGDHSVRKHEILSKYFEDYLKVRCGSIPGQSKFRFSVIDGFCGGGHYENGYDGSPLVFLQTLIKTAEEINIYRAAEGFSLITFECLFLFNDLAPSAMAALEANLAPYMATKYSNVNIEINRSNEAFETFYPKAKDLLKSRKIKNVLFNIDPCGHSLVQRETIVDIMQSFSSAEIFFTFMIQALVNFLNKNDTSIMEAQLKALDLSDHELKSLIDQFQTVISDKQWLGAAEQVVFQAFRHSAPYVSMFSINNPEGWRYWLVHFANSHRARQVYNDILHDNSNAQAHFGKSGLSMLSYDPRNENNMLYLFGESCREKAKKELYTDIPDFLGSDGEALTVLEFNQGIYNLTPAHSEDIVSVLHEHEDVEVLTPSGNPRRKASSIQNDDIIIRARQKTFNF